MRTTLYYLGVPVSEVSYMFDNESMVKSSKNLYSKLTECHNELSYHRVCEAIASGYVSFQYIKGKSNLSDILNKHLKWNDIKDTLLTIDTLNDQVVEDLNVTPNTEKKILQYLLPEGVT